MLYIKETMARFAKNLMHETEGWASKAVKSSAFKNTDKIVGFDSAEAVKRFVGPNMGELTKVANNAYGSAALLGSLMKNGSYHKDPVKGMRQFTLQGYGGRTRRKSRRKAFQRKRNTRSR